MMGISMQRFLGIAALALSSCTQVVTPEDEPVFSATYRGNYSAIADCTFSHLQKEMGQLVLSNLTSQKTVQISQGEYALIRWTLDIRDGGPDRSDVVFRSVRAVWGRDFYANQVVPSLKSCSH